ncbi:class I SAM-dependent methyltransferase [Actinopolymorpha alba]|uniref:class I SAM-dependent methyltransferase n=1 Tax=Actinopolymorpha alba TaxID=533267 RepID=UPI00037CACBD|nr:class I SAM-dependent methyltransferase [Actinopolymorpha alba]
MTVDHSILVGEAYADNSRLADRISIYAWQQPRIDIVDLALRRLGTVNGPVLDVGWGTGSYTNRLRATRPELRVVPVDLSAGMGPEVVGEVDRLPFADGSAGAALAMHMLYLATEPRTALRELRRVLRPGGRLLASTNGRVASRELADLWDTALRDLGVVDPPPYPNPGRRFLLEGGVELVREVFGACEVDEYHSEIVVPDATPVVAYVNSCRAEQARHLPDGVTWASYLAAVEGGIRAEVARTGAFRLTGHVGVIAATS